MKKYIDLHVHSTISDGTFTPSELVHYALKKNLAAFALTDHDTTDGLEEAFSAALGSNLEIIPGIELSTTWNSTDVHIVGLDIDWKNTHFQKTLSEFQISRNLRNEKMIALLQKEGIPITTKLMEEDFPDSVWTRAHFARFLFDHKYVGSMKEAFDRYLGNHAKCYVPREKVTPFQAIQLIHEGGGKAIFAHPILTKLSKERLENLVNELSRNGLDGIETLYVSYTPADELFTKQLAKRYGLKQSGGSDFHGTNKPHIDLGCGKGNLKIPYEILEQLRS
ncbi:MAG: PHP domain-containing protein [Blautia sp.]|nr:PHP domain-containing protein [Blautia sp.]